LAVRLLHLPPHALCGVCYIGAAVTLVAQQSRSRKVPVSFLARRPDRRPSSRVHHLYSHIFPRPSARFPAVVPGLRARITGTGSSFLRALSRSATSSSVNVSAPRVRWRGRQVVDVRTDVHPFPSTRTTKLSVAGTLFDPSFLTDPPCRCEGPRRVVLADPDERSECGKRPLNTIRNDTGRHCFVSLKVVSNYSSSCTKIIHHWREVLN